MIVLDTTVLVYAIGTDHALRTPCRRLIQAVTEDRVSATTTTEVVQEFAHVWARRRGRQAAGVVGRQYAELLSPLLRPDEDSLRHGLSLFQQHSPLGAFDACLAASALAAGANAFVSADHAFAAVPGLPHVVPDEDGVAGLLGVDGEHEA